MNNLDKYKLLPGMRTIKGQLKLLLRHHRMPGDILTMTPLIRDLKMTYGSQVQIYCDTPQGQEIWQNNPGVEHIDNKDLSIDEKTKTMTLIQRPGVEPLMRISEIKLDEIYHLDNKMAAENEARGLNMAEAFRQDFMRQSGLHINASTMWPDIYLTQKEIDDFKIKYSFRTDKDVKYWVVCPGNKSSCQVKIWPRSRWMEFFKQNKDHIFAQIGQSKHGHKPFDIGNVHNYIDKTTLRELFVLIYLSQGTIGYCSLHMHVAAAFKKPSLVLAGGRESPTLFKYPNHSVNSTVGCLPCNQYGGCYKGKGKTVEKCCSPYWFEENREVIPKCMDVGVSSLNEVFEYANITYGSSVPMEYDSMDKGRTDCIIDKFEGERFYGEKYVEDLAKLKEKRENSVKEKFKVTLKDNSIKADKELSEEEKKILCIGDGYVKKKDYEFKQKKPLFRMICNATCYGGGERTAIRIMKLMAVKRYDIEFVPATGNICQDTELLRNMPAECSIQDVYNKDKTIADIVFFQANDTLYRYYMAKNDDWVAPWFKAAKRRIIGVNYTTWGLGLEKYFANQWVCQSEKLKDDLITHFENQNKLVKDRTGNELRKMYVLKPPADLSRFFDYDYSKREYTLLSLIRHSSQGDQKYPNDINKQLRNMNNIKRNMAIYLMPPPTFLDYSGNKPKCRNFTFNELPVNEFLSYGNIFWYWVPKDKFIEAGCNAVLEAMASGLPILCNDNGGLVDIIDDEVGWICKTEDEMYEAIKNMTMDEIKRKGQAAKKKVKKLVDPDAWTKIIIGG